MLFYKGGKFIDDTEIRKTSLWLTDKVYKDNNDVIGVFLCDNNNLVHVSNRNCAVRPFLLYSSIKNQVKVIKDYGDGVLEVEIGEYPAEAMSRELQEKLAQLYNRDKLFETGNSYTFNSQEYNLHCSTN